jgi:hypothetical protein
MSDSGPISSPPDPAKGDGHYEEPSSPFFSAWATFVLKYRWVLLLLMAALTAWSIVQIRTALYVDNSMEAFFSNESDTVTVLEETRDLFGRDSLFLVMIEGDVFTDPFLRRLEHVHYELKALDIDVPSLGERKSDRDARRTCGALGRSDPAPDNSVVTGTERIAVDDFEDDDEFEEDPSENTPGEAAGPYDAGFEGEGSIVEEVVSLINARHTWSDQVGPDESPTLHVDKLMDPLPEPSQLAQLKASTLVSPTLVGQVVDKEGRFAVIAIRTDFMSEQDSAQVYKRVVTIIAKYNGEGFRVNVAGMPALAASLNRVMLRDLRIMLLFSVIGQFIILFWLFRHIIGVIGPIIVVVLAVVWSLAMMASLCMPMTMLTNIMPAFLVCVGVADAVHLQSVYRQVRKRGLINYDAIVYAVSTTGLPILFTSLTTMAGLLSFRFASVPAIGNMGTASAFGVFVAFVNSLVLLPIILSFNKRSLLGLRSDDQEVKHFDPLGWMVHALGALSGSVPGLSRIVANRRRRWTLVGAGVLFIVCAYNASLLKVWHDPLSWIPGDRSIKEAFTIMDEHVGGTVSVLAVVRAKEGYTVKDRDILLGMEKLEEKVREYRVKQPNGKEMTLVGNSISLVDLVKETYKAMVPGDSNNYRIPDTQAQISQFVEQFSMKAPSERKYIVSMDEKATLMTMRTRWMEATSYGPFTKYVEQAAKKFIPAEKATVQLTGTIYSLFTTVSALLWNMMQSFGLAFCVISVLMVLTLRSWKLGLIAMVPNLLPIVCILGLMGATDIPIDMANLLIASIALGIAVDDTIHFLHHWRVHYESNGDVDAAIAYSFDHSGRAMVSTTLILTVGFFVYLSSSMAHMQRFGMLIGLTVIMALLIDLVVAPALLRSAYKNK